MGLIFIYKNVSIYKKALNNQFFVKNNEIRANLIRVNLEGLMAEFAAERITKTQLMQLKELLYSMEADMGSKEYALKNREFHQMIHDASGLIYIKSIVQKHWDYLLYLEAQELLFRNKHLSRSMCSLPLKLERVGLMAVFAVWEQVQEIPKRKCWSLSSIA